MYLCFIIELSLISFSVYRVQYLISMNKIRIIVIHCFITKRIMGSVH